MENLAGVLDDHGHNMEFVTFEAINFIKDATDNVSDIALVYFCVDYLGFIVDSTLLICLTFLSTDSTGPKLFYVLQSNRSS